MKEFTETPPDPAMSGLSRRHLLSALAMLTATPMLANEANAALPRFADVGAAAVIPLPRRLHTATPLGNGLVLVTGGVYKGVLADSLLFQPATGLWYPAAPMHTPRAQHAAVLLGDGRVLVLGGFYLGALADVEIYDPAVDSWTAAPPMTIPRSDHSATLLDDGTVLIYGGIYQGLLDAPEIYTPTRPGNG